MSTTTTVSRIKKSLSALLALALLACLSGCGPASSDKAPGLEPRASVGGPSESQPTSQNSPAIPNDPVTPAASAVPLASPLASNHEPAPEAPAEPTPRPEFLVLPDWIAQALDHRDVAVRLTALDRWAQQGSNVPLDPLVVALDDENDEVRERAMAIIEQHWAVEQKTSEQPIAGSEEPRANSRQRRADNE